MVPYPRQATDALPERTIGSRQPDHGVNGCYAARRGSSRPAALRIISVTAIYRDAAQAAGVFGFARVTRRAVEAGYMSAAEGDEWLRYLSTERFFASVSLFVTLAEKPGSWGGPGSRQIRSLGPNSADRGM